jgi:hypothetical protein
MYRPELVPRRLANSKALTVAPQLFARRVLCARDFGDQRLGWSFAIPLDKQQSRKFGLSSRAGRQMGNMNLAVLNFDPTAREGMAQRFPDDDTGNSVEQEPRRQSNHSDNKKDKINSIHDLLFALVDYVGSGIPPLLDHIAV